MPNHLKFAAPYSIARLSGWFAILALALPMRAQGEFVNYEVGGVSPIATQTFSAGSVSRSVLMVCNTANDSLEFYDADSLTFIKRIPTGLAPVTVRWNASTGHAYTCNKLGDSLTCVGVSASDGGGFVSLDISLEATFAVGDEPCDIAFVPNTEEAMVSLRSRSAVARVNLSTRQILDARHILDVDNGNGDHWAVKNPRNVAFAGNDRFYALDHQSDGMDLDLFAAQGPGNGTNPLYDAGSMRFKVNGLGTTHANFAINQAGDKMFVVGMRSTPKGSTTEPGVGALKTGFTQSWIWVVDLLPVPMVRLDSPGVGSTEPSINLNRDYSALPLLEEVQPSEAIAQPTGIAIVEAGGAVQKLVVTAFSSDAVAILTPNATSASGWDIQKLNLAVLDSSYSMVGPRQVVVNEDSTKAYVFGSLDNTIREIDIANPTATLGNATPLLFDPTPLAIRSGREFLYGAHHSGSKMVSCSSCHIDGHTDGLVWTLNQGPQGPLPNSFITGGGVPTQWPANKGPMVTQSLRGLVNHDVDGPAQLLFTNAPYHWRGDRKDFPAFNGAFVDLMNRSEGLLEPAQMATYTEFIETVMLPPNPEQPTSRRLSGSMGNSSWDPAEGTGMKRGLKLYHGINFALTCAHCHVLPEGSGNRATQFFEIDPPFHQNPNPGPIHHPIEPAAIRHLFDRESGLQLGSGPADPTPILLKDAGLTHTGFLESPAQFNSRIDFSTGHFVQFRFLSNMPGNPNNPNHNAEQVQQTLDLTAFVRALDTGSAPMIGVTYTLGSNGAANRRALLTMIEQVHEANAGLVAHVDLPGIEQSYWYDATRFVFRDDATQATTTTTALLNLFGPQNVIVLQSVPVGSARRIADYGNVAAVDSGPAPESISLEPMTFPTHWADGGDLQARWDPNTGPQLYASELQSRESHKRMIYMQRVLIGAAQSGFDTGINTQQHIKHELPRRFRVTGDNIRSGAELVLELPRGSGAPIALRMPIFPTKYREPTTGRRIWETTVAADGEMTLALLNGGLFQPNVWDLIQFTDLNPPSYPQLDPATDNSYVFTVRNADGTNASGQAPLRVNHDR